MLAHSQSRERRHDDQTADPNKSFFDHANTQIVLKHATALNDVLPYTALQTSLQSLQRTLGRLEQQLPGTTPVERSRYIHHVATTNEPLAQWTAALHDTVRFVAALTQARDDPDDDRDNDQQRGQNLNIRRFVEANRIKALPVVEVVRPGPQHIQAQLHHEMLRQQALAAGKVSWLSCSGTLRLITQTLTAAAIIGVGKIVLADIHSLQRTATQGSVVLAPLGAFFDSHPTLKNFLDLRLFSIAFDVVAVGGIVLNAPGQPALTTAKALKTLGLKYVKILLPLVVLGNPAFTVGCLPAVVMRIVLRGTVTMSTEALDKGLDLVLDHLLVYEATPDALALQVLEAEAQRALRQQMDWEQFVKDAHHPPPPFDPATPSCWQQVVRWLRTGVPWRTIGAYVGSTVAVAAFALAIAQAITGISMVSLVRTFVPKTKNLVAFLLTDNDEGENVVWDSVLPTLLDPLLAATVLPWLTQLLGNLVKTLVLTTARTLGVTQAIQYVNRHLEELVSTWWGRTIVWEHTVASIAAFCYHQLVGAGGVELAPYVRFGSFMRMHRTGSFSHAARGAWAVVSQASPRDPEALARLFDMEYMVPAMMIRAEGTVAGDFLYDSKRATTALYQIQADDTYRDLTTGEQLDQAAFLARPGSTDLLVDVGLRNTHPVDPTAPLPPYIINIHTGAHVDSTTLSVPATEKEEFMKTQLKDYRTGNDAWYVYRRPLRVPAFYSHSAVALLQLTPEHATLLTHQVRDNPKLAVALNTKIRAQNQILANMADIKQKLQTAQAVMDREERHIQGHVTQWGLLLSETTAFSPAVRIPLYMSGKGEVGALNPKLRDALATTAQTFPDVVPDAVFAALRKAHTTDQQLNGATGQLTQGLQAGRKYDLDTEKKRTALKVTEEIADGWSWTSMRAQTPAEQNARQRLPGLRREVLALTAAEQARIARQTAPYAKGPVPELARLGLLDDYEAGRAARAEFLDQYQAAHALIFAHKRATIQQQTDEVLARLNTAQQDIYAWRDNIVTQLEAYNQRVKEGAQLGVPLTLPADPPTVDVAGLAAQADHIVNAASLTPAATAGTAKTPQPKVTQTTKAVKVAPTKAAKVAKAAQTKVTPMQRLAGQELSAMEVTGVMARYQEKRIQVQAAALQQGQAQDLSFLFKMAAAFDSGHTVSKAELDRLSTLVSKALDNNPTSLVQEETKQDLGRCQHLLEGMSLNSLGHVISGETGKRLSLAESRCLHGGVFGKLIDGAVAGLEAVLLSLTALAALSTGGWGAAFVKAIVWVIRVVGLQTAGILLMTALAKITSKCKDKATAPKCDLVTTQNHCASLAPDCTFTNGTCVFKYNALTCSAATIMQSLLCSSVFFSTLAVGTCVNKLDIYYSDEEVLEELAKIATRPVLPGAQHTNDQLLADVMAIARGETPGDDTSRLDRYYRVVHNLFADPGTRSLGMLLFFGNKFSGLRREANLFMDLAAGSSAREIITFFQAWQDALLGLLRSGGDILAYMTGFGEKV